MSAQSDTLRFAAAIWLHDLHEASPFKVTATSIKRAVQELRADLRRTDKHRPWEYEGCTVSDADEIIRLASVMAKWEAAALTETRRLLREQVRLRRLTKVHPRERMR